MEKQTTIIQPYTIQFKIKEKKKSSLPKALFKTLLISYLVGAVYGLSNFLFNTNVVFMPIIGVAAVSYVYNSNYNEVHIKPIIRLMLGLICSLQILIAFLVCELAYSRVLLYPGRVGITISEFFRYTLENPVKQATPIFLLGICFIYGALQDYTFRFQGLCRKLLMKKSGKYYFKKEGHILSIYIIDPADYDEKDRDRLIAYITGGCFIEMRKKSVKAFSLSKSNLDEARINLENDGTIIINGDKYYKLDFGSIGMWEKYTAPCALIMDGKQNVEVVQIELP